MPQPYLLVSLLYLSLVALGALASIDLCLLARDNLLTKFLNLRVSIEERAHISIAED